jgi:hypothetical protein
MNKPSPKQSVRPVAAAPPAPRRKSRKKNELLVVGGILGVLAICLVIAGRDVIFGTSQPADSPHARQPNGVQPKSTTTTAQPSTAAANDVPAAAPSPDIDDDGKTLWTSPTNGKPLDLAFLPPGQQLVVSLRPAALLKHSEGEKIQAALGPLGMSAVESVERITGMQLAEMDRLVVGLQTSAGSVWIPTFVVRSTTPLSREAILAKQSETTAKEHAGKSYWLTSGRAYYFPGGSENKVFVVAPESAIADVIDMGGQSPPLRRDIERLIDHTDGDRQVTIVLAPNSLFGEGQTIFSGQISRLRNPLFWFLGDELSGVAISLNWDANFFLELIATPTLDTPPEKAARVFADRVSQIPLMLEEYVVGLNAQPYGRLVIARFPEMLRKLAIYTRRDFDSEHAVLRCYLPPAAGHNLLMAAELTLAETPGAASVSEALPDAKAAASAAPAASVQEKLAKVTSLKFARDTLESALDLLSQDIGVPITIRGPDLQADGITKNQSFGIDVADKPAADILVEILRLANPDKTATGPNDARQKLVYIIEQRPDKTEQIVVTTRAKVTERNDELPDVFRAEM